MRLLRYILFFFCLLTSANVVSSDAGSLPSAGEAFARGLVLLHNFEYDDAVEYFLQMQQDYPDYAMAYWGEAMAYNQPVWSSQDIEKARAALLKLGASSQLRADRAGDRKTALYLAAADTLFFGPEWRQRDVDYRQAMKGMHEAYPDDPDITALYALSILGTSHDGRDLSLYLQAAEIMKPALRKHPHHPGLLHYTIHALDDPLNAAKAIDAADRYALVAPDSAHALHMPTHVYFSLGLWHKANALNERSFAASLARSQRKGVVLDVHGVHSLRWLPYGYLQANQPAEAERIYQRAVELVEQGLLNGDTLLYLDSTIRLQTRAWQRVLPDAGLADEGDISRDRFVADFALVYQSVCNGKLAAADDARRRLLQAMAAFEKQASAAATGRRVMLLELDALLALQRGERDDALQLITEATVLEDSMPYDYGPAWPMLPAHEFHGLVLLGSGEYSDAKMAFTRSMKRFPNRYLSQRGAQLAADEVHFDDALQSLCSAKM